MRFSFFSSRPLRKVAVPLVFSMLLAGGPPAEAEPPVAAAPLQAAAAEMAGLLWLDDYAAARQRAIDERKMLLVYFRGDSQNPRCGRFERETLPDPQAAAVCENYVRVRLPLEATIQVAGRTLRLLEDPSFAAIGGKPGLAVVDFVDREKSYYEHTVGILPFEQPGYYAPAYESAESVVTFLNLPTGTMTQRMLIYAVRMHPDRPRSTAGRVDLRLMNACGDHSRHQAEIGRQGHHRWETRFREIWRAIGGAAPTEICAESWPDETLLIACLGCVDAWRHSSGHWNAVTRLHLTYGYDIRRGQNGIWYATGIFGG
jgi:hypothetical protein